MSLSTLRLMLTVAGVWSATLLFAAQKAEQAADDASLLQGEWSFTGYEVDGQKAPADILKKIGVTFKEDKLAIKPMPVSSGAGDKMEFRLEREFEARCVLGAAEKVRTLDLVVVEGADPMKGIYRLDGDELQICWSTHGERPTEFAAKEGSANRLLQMKRVKR